MESSKKLIILCDGMWCGRKAKTETNVHLLAQYIGIDLEHGKFVLDNQENDNIARYFDGIGLGNVFLDYAFNESTYSSIEISRKEVYRYIVDNFAEHQEVWMFGLGTGASVVRRVASMISEFGIIKKGESDYQTTEHCEYVESLLKAPLWESVLLSDERSKFKAKYTWQVSKPIKFVGLIDMSCRMRLPYLNRLLGSGESQSRDNNWFDAVDAIYHAMAMHERLMLIEQCFEEQPKNATQSTWKDSLPRIYERWFPGTHYDVGRQKIRLGQGIRKANSLRSLVLDTLWRTVHPNQILSDLVLRWMLESIRMEDKTGTVVRDLDRKIFKIDQRLTSGLLSTGSGDIRDSIVEYVLPGYQLAYLNNWLYRKPAAAVIGSTIVRTEERQILDLKAESYDYKRPIDQSGATIEQLANMSSRRYPSQTYEDFQYRRFAASVINLATYQCLVGKEEPKEIGIPESSERRIVMRLSWEGPEFFKSVNGSIEDVFTITRVEPGSDRYIARTVRMFLEEFYGDFGKALLDWVKRLCVFKPRVSNEGIKQQARVERISTHPEKPPTVLETTFIHVVNTLHLHVDNGSVTAQFDDDHCAFMFPGSSEWLASLLRPALSWVATVFQTPKRETESLNLSSCPFSYYTVGPPKSVPFKPEESDCSCWLQLFQQARIMEAPPNLDMKMDGHPGGLQIDFDTLMVLARVSSGAWFYTDNAVILTGLDSALIQCEPVASNRWHFLRVPGRLIGPNDIETAFPYLQPLIRAPEPENPHYDPSYEPISKSDEDDDSDTEVESTPEPIRESMLAEATEEGPEHASTEKVGQVTEQPQYEAKAFKYPSGKVYVGWCDGAQAVFITGALERNILEAAGRLSSVPRVTNLKDVTTMTRSNNISIGAKFGFLGSGGDLRWAVGREQTFTMLTTGTRTAIQIDLDGTLNAARNTPYILWDNREKRAWLLPGTCALLFVALCYIGQQRWNFQPNIAYPTSSTNPGNAATECINANADNLKISNDNRPQLDWPFARIIQQVWESMRDVHDQLGRRTNGNKFIMQGNVFGYDLSELLGHGQVQLRGLTRRVAGRNLRSWEQLARFPQVSVIFCNYLGPVIECHSQSPFCACTPHCQSIPGTRGSLSCFLPDFKALCFDWTDYTAVRGFPIDEEIEWIPTNPFPFGHTQNCLANDKGPCDCCNALDRLQTIVLKRDPGIRDRVRQFFVRPLPNSLKGANDVHIKPTWIGSPYAIRFGTIS
ncbi:hypothetical protein ONS95_004462 [Cadophora gregata]|uniref:uncharacterized protein n=1 Tax=Cadophora gregata TaxID=51156 RepID=UPI0026DB344F|nr:uncharacterized protein ONS95_004462 [Cadophora gregata]KAK0105951.1 hypothetical protein ONS95_004462 [Cadophora gregata]